MLVAGYVLLALLAALCVALPVLMQRFSRAGDVRQADRQQTARGWYRQRLDELAQDQSDSQLQEELNAELGQVFLQEWGTDADREPAATGTEVDAGQSPPPSRLPYVLALLVPVLGWLLFTQLADLGAADIRGAEAVLQLSGEQHQTQLGSWQARLQQRVQAVPDDSKSLYLLGHTYLKLADYEQSAAAFARAYELREDDLSIRVYWLQARFLAAGGKLDRLSMDLAEKILAQVPNMAVVLEMLALDAVGKQDPASAVRYLNQALANAQNSQQQVSFVAAISQLRKQIELPGIAVDIQAAAPIPHDAVLFVIARPVGGGMPYAVVKMPAMLLPQQVQLDDLVTMNPAVKLSTAGEFEVVVRLSRSGTPMARPEDWSWRSEPMQLGQVGPLQVTLSPP